MLLDIFERLRSGTYVGDIKDLNADHYHSLDKYISSSQLKYLHAKSPKHYYHKYIAKEIPPEAPTSNMILGSAVHDKISGHFNKTFYVAAKADGRTKEGKAQRLMQIEEAGQRQIIDDETDTLASKITDSVLDNEPAAKLLRNAEKEASFFWTCPFSGLKLRSRIDALSDDYFVELKTATDASPNGFQRQCYNLNYDLSLFHYGEGLRVLNNKMCLGYFIVVETSAPFTVQCYKASDELFESGRIKWLEATSKLSAADKNSIWPSYSSEEYLDLYPPKWADKGKLVLVEDEV